MIKTLLGTKHVICCGGQSAAVVRWRARCFKSRQTNLVVSSVWKGMGRAERDIRAGLQNLGRTEPESRHADTCVNFEVKIRSFCPGFNKRLLDRMFRKPSKETLLDIHTYMCGALMNMELAILKG